MVIPNKEKVYWGGKIKSVLGRKLCTSVSAAIIPTIHGTNELEY